MSLIEYQSDQCLGIRTRARIAKGVKEDQKKTKPGKLKKGKKYNSESDLWYDRFRVKSSLGGQSSNSLSASQAKPKIFRHFQKLKRKKLYCPIKHCVRIQIPRKGYFYRSTVRFKAPGSTPSVQRLESSIGPKSRSTVQIPGLAPTSPKSPDLLKKRLNKQGEVPKPAAPAPVEHLDGEVANRKTSNKDPGQTLENPMISSSRKAKSQQTKRKSKSKQQQQQQKSPRGAEDVPEVSGTSSERIISICKSEIRTPPPSETSFDTLLSCLSRILGKDEGLCDLEISPVRTGAGESSFDSDFQMLRESSASPNFELTEVVAAFDSCCETREKDAIYMSPTASLTLRNFGGDNGYGLSSEDNIANALIGEIDLHLELENYLHAIDGLTGARNRTKNALQCNLHEDGRKDEFFDVTENKSNSTFASATSVCTQQDGDANQLHVFLDRKHDMSSLSEEHIDSRNAKLFISELGDARKIRSDNEPKKIQQEGKLKSSIKRTMGKTSFRSEEKMWMLPPVVGEQSVDSSADSYEKILPFGCHSNKSCDDRNRSNLLYSNSVYSLSAESFSTAVRKSASESDWRKMVPVRMTKSEDRFELLLPEGTSSSSVTMRTIPDTGSKSQLWSPSLQELIEIYNSVLKKNKKIRSNSRTSVSRCISSHLFSFLNGELKEKECKANLVLLSRKLNKRLKVPEMWKPGRQKKDDTLVQYVTMFQEILKSSMSISQIALLNNITSGLQDHSARNCTFVDNLEKVQKKREKFKRPQEPRKVEEEPTKKLTENPSSEKVVTTVRPPSVSSAGKPKKSNVGKETKPEEEAVAMEEITKIDLTSPTELESILQSCFAAGSADGRDPNDKILVTVKLCGKHIFVSKLSYFKNEKALLTPPGSTKQSGTSQLIIESVTKDQVKNQMRDAWYKKTKSSKLREVKNAGGPNKPTAETKVKPRERPKKVKKHSKPSTLAPAAAAEEGPTDTYIDNNSSSSLQSEIEQQICLPFEYDQMQLRAQHPIECIIESSESRISDDIESSGDDVVSSRKTEPPTGKKFLAKEVHQTTPVKAALTEALAEKVYSKDLGCSFGWDDGRFDKSLNRTKSHVISRKGEKNQPLTKKNLNRADAVRSLSDLKRKPKTRKNVRRKFGSYLCYPSILNLQENQPPPVKKKSKKRLRQKNHLLHSSNSALYPRRSAASAKASKTAAAAAAAAEELTSDSSMGSINLTNSEMVPYMELLYDNEIPSTSVTPKMSTTAVKQNLKTVSSADTCPSVPGKDSQASAIAAEDVKESSTVIHPPRSDCDDMSFPSLMVHSDSFLRYYSSLPLTPENLNLLLKSSSDRKFYPGRVTSSDRQQSPFVKFMLTPTQNADGGLPPHQVQVVDRKRAAVVDGGKKGRPTSATSEDIDDKISLPSIEKFIKKLSRSNMRVKPKSKAEKPKPEGGKETPSSASKTFQKKCSSTLGQKSRSKTADRKAYHECQKRRLSDKAKADEKKAKTTTKSTEKKPKPTEKKQPKEANDSAKQNKDKAAAALEPESSEINFLSLKNFVMTLTQIMESYQNFSRENARNQRVTIPKEELTVAETDCKTEGAEREGHVEKGTNTISEAKCSLTRMSDATADGPVKAPQAVKSAVTQTEEFLETRKNAEQEFEREMQKRNSSYVPETRAEGPPVRKSKTLKIKIHCDSNNNNNSSNKDGSKAGKEAMNSVAVNRKPQRLDEKGLLDSLVVEEAEVGVLERRNSSYFDAIEKHSDEENESCRSEWGREEDQQEFLAYWSTVEPVNLSAGLFQRKEPDRSPRRIPPDELAELVYDEILKSLQAGKICRSLTLLDKFLQTAECSPSWSANSERLRKLLLLVNSESKNLMLGLEKNAWLKVFFLLEDMSRMFGRKDVSAKGFIEKIQGLNDRRLLDLRNSYFSLSQTNLTGNSRFKNVFCRITDSLKYLKNSFYMKRRRCSERRSREETAIGRHSIHSTRSLLNVPDRPETSPLQRLRKQIQQQKAYIEFLLSADCGYVPHKIQDVKRKVLEKMRTFERMFSTVQPEGRSMMEGPTESRTWYGKSVSSEFP